MEASFSQSSPQNRILETPIRRKKFRKGSYFLVKNSRKGQYRDHTVAHPRAKIS